MDLRSASTNITPRPPADCGRLNSGGWRWRRPKLGSTFSNRCWVGPCDRKSTGFCSKMQVSRLVCSNPALGSNVGSAEQCSGDQCSLSTAGAPPAAQRLYMQLQGDNNEARDYTYEGKMPKTWLARTHVPSLKPTLTQRAVWTLAACAAWRRIQIRKLLTFCDSGLPRNLPRTCLSIEFGFHKEFQVWLNKQDIWICIRRRHERLEAHCFLLR